MATSKAIIISVPKYPRFRAVSMPLQMECSKIPTSTRLIMEQGVACLNHWDESDENSTDSSFHGCQKTTPTRKRRLEHLTYEEKMQRKKLKNRVAAQTSRDRKKARMDELEVEVKELNEKYKTLSEQYKDLLARNETLELENRLLQEKAELRPQTRDVGCGPLCGPAASPADPLPWGQGPQLAASLKATLLLIFCLLSQTFSQTSMMIISPNWTNWHTACSKMLPTSKEVNFKEFLRPMLPVKNRRTHNRWWGRHQRCWNPVGLMAAM